MANLASINRQLGRIAREVLKLEVERKRLMEKPVPLLPSSQEERELEKKFLEAHRKWTRILKLMKKKEQLVRKNVRLGDWVLVDGMEHHGWFRVIGFYDYNDYIHELERPNEYMWGIVGKAEDGTVIKFTFRSVNGIRRGW